MSVTIRHPLQKPLLRLLLQPNGRAAYPSWSLTLWETGRFNSSCRPLVSYRLNQYSGPREKSEPIHAGVWAPSQPATSLGAVMELITTLCTSGTTERQRELVEHHSYRLLRWCRVCLPERKAFK